MPEITEKTQSKEEGKNQELTDLGLIKTLTSDGAIAADL